MEGVILKNKVKQKKLDYSQEHKKFLARHKHKKIFILSCQIGILVIFLGLWEILAHFNLINTLILSSPSRILATIGALYESGELFYHIGITLFETLLGFIISTVVGCLIAILLWWSDTLRKILDPYIVVLNSLPKIALGPVIIIWVGAGMQSIVVICILITIIITIISMLNAFRECDKDKILLMQSMGANKFQILTKLILPATLPEFVSVLKISIGMSWVGSIIGDYLVSSAGLGYLIVYGSQVFRLDLVMASTLILCILASIMYLLVALLEKYVNKKRS